MNDNYKNKLLDLIVSGGACNFYCPGCPIRHIKKPMSLCDDGVVRIKAIFLFIKKYGKKSLVEYLI